MSEEDEVVRGRPERKQGKGLEGESFNWRLPYTYPKALNGRLLKGPRRGSTSLKKKKGGGKEGGSRTKKKNVYNALPVLFPFKEVPNRTRKKGNVQRRTNTLPSRKKKE